MINRICVIFSGLLLALFFLSCKDNSEYRLYHGDWIINGLNIGGISNIDTIGLFNLSINIDQKELVLPGVYNPFGQIIDFKQELKLNQVDNDVFLMVKDHFLFSDTFKIVCVESCCKLKLLGNRIIMELDYNGDLPYGRSRNCPPAKFPDIFVPINDKKL